MYESFYGMTRNPFGLSPDPRFYYPTPAHNEALANLSYGISKRKGIIVLTGEVGTGKTLLLRYLIEALIKAKIHYSYIFNPKLSPADFLHYVMADFGIKQPGTSRGEMLLQFNQFLIDVYRRGSTAVLLVDEAHQLSTEVLEELRLLTNIETSQQKLLQIVLVGQPELDELLDSNELRQLKQRIALRCRLQPLDEANLHGYIVCRLQKAGAGERAAELFPREALDRIRHYSGGVPRLINTICDSALVNGYARRETAIHPEEIEEVAADLRLNVYTQAPKRGSNGDSPEEALISQIMMRLAKAMAGGDHPHAPAPGSAAETPGGGHEKAERVEARDKDHEGSGVI
ncbi:MAG: AAA family ATPase [Terriglobales bacterium]|jgi:general secretion pathway protein A